MYSTTARSLPRGSGAVPPALRPAGCQDVPDQVDGQDVGQRLGGEPPAGAAGRQLGIHRRHRGPQGREVQAVERRDRQPRRVEVERLGGDPRDQPRLQEDVEPVEAPAPAPPGRAAGRHHRDRSRGGRYVPLHSFIQQVQLLRRPGKKDEPVVGQGRAGRVPRRGPPVASRLQADPPQPVTRRGRLERDDLAQDCQGPERAAASRLLLSHYLCFLNKSGR